MEEQNLLSEFYQLLKKSNLALPKLSPGLRSVITGNYERQEFDSAFDYFMVDFEDAIKETLPALNGEDIDLEDFLIWKAYRGFERGNWELYVSETNRAREIIQRGKELKKKYNYMGPPSPLPEEKKDSALREFSRYLSVFEEALDSRFLEAYYLFGQVLSNKTPDASVLSLFSDLRQSVEKLRQYEMFNKPVENRYEIEFTFNTRDEIREVVEAYLETGDWDSVKTLLSLEGKILEVEKTGGGIKLTPFAPSSYLSWEDFGGYTHVVEGVKGWINAIDSGVEYVNKLLLAGFPGTGKTTLLKVAMREAAERGFICVYLTKVNGADLSLVESLTDRLVRYFPNSRFISAKDDIEKDLITPLQQRDDSLRVLEDFNYPLIATVNPQFNNGLSVNDSAILRRLDNVLYFDLPTTPEREEIARIIARKKGVSLKDEDYTKLVNLSNKTPGAYIELLINRHAIFPNLSWDEVHADLKKTYSWINSVSNLNQADYV